jgi:hypothetical protein
LNSSGPIRLLIVLGVVMDGGMAAGVWAATT